MQQDLLGWRLVLGTGAGCAGGGAAALLVAAYGLVESWSAPAGVIPCS
jgi:hypothetical protein